MKILFRCIALLASAGAAFGQTATYPTAVATDQQLSRAANNIETMLAGSMSETDTTMTVSSSSGIVVNSILTVDAERVWVCSISGQTLTLGHTACPSSDGRGVDGSTAQAHSARASVRGFVTAWSHNAVAEEIKAVEQALGANLANVGDAGTTAQFDFDAQSLGATGLSLAPGNNVITVAPVPAGVNGSDTNHPLWISGGTGTAEACYINGGSAVAGQPSGQLILNCTNAHGGNWTLRSATAGAQEQMQASGIARFGEGLFNIYAPIHTLSSSGAIIGQGVFDTVIANNSLTTPAVTCTSGSILARDFRIMQVGTPVAGSTGILLRGGGSSTPGSTCNDGHLENIFSTGAYDGMVFDGGTDVINTVGLTATNSVRDGFQIYTAQGNWSGLSAIFNGRHGVYNARCTAGSSCGYSPQISGVSTFGNAGWGIYSTNVLQISGGPSFLNADVSGELYLQNSGSDVGWVKDMYVQYSGQLGAGPVTNITAPGILVDSGTGATTFENIHCYHIQGNCIESRSGYTNINTVIAAATGQGAQAGNIFDLKLSGTANVVEHVVGGAGIYGAGGQSTIVNSYIAVPTGLPNNALELASGTQWTVCNNFFGTSGSGAAFITAAGTQVADCTNQLVGTISLGGSVSSGSVRAAGYNSTSVAASAIASAATVTITADQVSIDGTATISTFTTTSGLYGLNRFCARAKAAWSTTTGGNIANAFTATPATAYCFTRYENGFWYVN